MNSILLAFVTGLTTGGISCLAVQGGLLTSALSQKSKEQSDLPYVSMFLVFKIFAYTLLGFGLGAIGSSLKITAQAQGWLQIFAGVFMIITALRLLDVHPIFRRFVIQPPKFAFKVLRNQSKANSFFAPAFLGFLTVLIPCGITQGMMVLAVSTANPITAAGIMFGFTLGTSPVFLVLGIASAKLMEKKAFLYIASGVILFLGILSINTGQALRGSAHTFQNYVKVLGLNNSASAKEEVKGTTKLDSDGKQNVTIAVTSYGYKADSKVIKAGVPVKLTLVTNNTQGCSRAFNIPSMNISKLLPLTGTESVEFTPTKTGLLTYTCSMGMYTGAFNVI
ncbi:sulfite exporter TauE/SafE family protein [Candidatus Woesebacteria bacterium]|nr:sulfite exporter TauE/SafE family protein [Candidatus Woesebacteria bacterium]QQG47889.1 MAG: sulfite exporter TauE/SafE family protein [Candidatus Woesebacteria bacterium]